MRSYRLMYFLSPRFLGFLFDGLLISVLEMATARRVRFLSNQVPSSKS
jgi:hypothetical protein